MPTANLINAKMFGEMLSLSKRQIFRLNSSGKIPEPVRIGSSTRWIESEIAAWIDTGCPDRKAWEVLKGLKDAS